MIDVSSVSVDEAAAIYAETRRRRSWLFNTKYSSAPTIDQVVTAELRRRRVQAILDEWRPRRRIRPGENPLLEAIEVLSGGHPRGSIMGGEWGGSLWADTLVDAAEFRQKLAYTFSWAVPNEAVLEMIARRSPIVEVGAGSGYWAALLRHRGADVAATDARPGHNHWVSRLWSPVARAPATFAAEWAGIKTLLLVWPPHGDDRASADALAAYEGDRVIYVGEQEYGCTGSEAFHEALEGGWEEVDEVTIPQWPGIHDTAREYVRRRR